MVFVWNFYHKTIVRGVTGSYGILPDVNIMPIICNILDW